MKAVKIYLLIAAWGTGLIALAAFKKAPPNPQHTVTFINKYYDNMNIQVRLGSSRNPEDNRLCFDANLARNQHISVPYSDVCWYRRDANPNEPDGNYTKWNSPNCPLDGVCEIDNP